MTEDSKTVLEERISNIQKELNDLPNYIDKLENKIVNRVDLLLTTSFRAIEDSLKSIKETLRDHQREQELLKNKDHDFELKLKDLVKEQDFKEYKAENKKAAEKEAGIIVEKIKTSEDRIKALEDSKRFFDGGTWTVAKVFFWIGTILGMILLLINIYNGAKTAERSMVNQQKIEELQRKVSSEPAH